MITSPNNIIEGLILMIQANEDEINSVIRAYSADDKLHLFKGFRRTLPDLSFPSLEMEAASSTMKWEHTSAMSTEYMIDCVLTIHRDCPNEAGMDYISELARKIVQIFNYPQNMSWVIPNEYQDKAGTPVLCQYSDIRNVKYSSARGLTLRVARWKINCRVLETFPHPADLLGPAKIDWKEDIIPQS